MSGAGGLWLGTWAKFLLGWRLGPYVPTPPHVVSRMLRLARVETKDVVYDLGCGDGRVCIAAAREHGARAVGFELDAALASEARHNVFAEGDALASRVEIREEDALAADVKSASVVVMYLSDGGNAKVLPGLAPLAPGARVVTFTFPLCARMRPTRRTRVDGIDLFVYTKGAAADAWVDANGDTYAR